MQPHDRVVPLTTQRLLLWIKATTPYGLDLWVPMDRLHFRFIHSSPFLIIHMKLDQAYLGKA